MGNHYITVDTEIKFLLFIIIKGYWNLDIRVPEPPVPVRRRDLRMCPSLRRLTEGQTTLGTRIESRKKIRGSFSELQTIYPASRAFLSGKSFSMYENVSVPNISRCWLVYLPESTACERRSNLLRKIKGISAHSGRLREILETRTPLRTSVYMLKDFPERNALRVGYI